MAEIYRAKTFAAHGFEREYAVKKILPHLVDDREFLDMFIDEARLAAQLHHPNIVQVFDLGEIGRQFYITMECVHGKDLLEVLARCDVLQVRLPLKLALYLSMSMLRGLDYAHRARGRKGEILKIIHRDVSPCNILLSYTGDVKIGDFGVAKATTQRARTEVGMLKGKVGYMSPEQINGEEIDHRSDIFSAGVILFEMLTMRRLFMGQNDLDVMLKIRDGEIEEDLGDLDFLPEELRRIVTRALSHSRQVRYQSAGAFHRDLLDFVFRSDLRVSEDDLGRFLRRIFAREYQEETDHRYADPEDPTDFPNLESPQVARYRFREPNGLIVGPMSLETLMSILKHRKDEAGSAVSRDSGPWKPMMEFPEVAEALESLRTPADRGIASSHHLGLSKGDTAVSERRRARRSKSAEFLVGDNGVEEEDDFYEGDLVRVPFPMLLYDLWEQKDDGLLTVSQRAVQKDIYLADGSPGYVASNKSDELLGNFLCEGGVISPSQLQIALERLSEFGGRLGDVLVRECMLPSVELFHYLSLQARQKLLDVFTWDRGGFSWHPGKVSAYEMYPLGINLLEIIVQGIRTRTTMEMIQSTFAGRHTRDLSFVSDGPLNLDGLNMSARELGIAAAARDGKNLESVVRHFDGSPHVREQDVWRVLFILYSTRLLRFEETGAHQPSPGALAP